MVQKKLCVFSPCGELFVCVNDSGILSIWETSSNNVKQEFDVKLHLETTCSSIIWGTFQITNVEKEDGSNEIQFLVIGTKSGEIFIYDYNIGKLYNHFNAGHVSDVNDLSLYCETNSLFSCSSDKTVIIWDTISGKIKQKWNADEEEIHSLCVVDSKNLLTGGTSVIWWNIENQSIIKKIQIQEAPVTLLKVVASLNMSYFLCASMNASKISAWSLKERNTRNDTVASFVIDSEPENMDCSKTFSNDNPLLLTAVTRTGQLVFFQHVLNGKTKNLAPQMTVEIISKPTSGGVYPSTIPILSSKILDCAESCIIAYGDDDCPVFESVNIFDCPEKLTLSRQKRLPQKVYDCFVSKVKLCKKLKGNAMANGNTPPDLSYNSPKRRRLLQTSANSEASSVNKVCLEDRILSSSPNVKKKQKLLKKLDRPKTPESDSEEIIVPTDPCEIIVTLLRGIENENSRVINSVLQCDKSDLIRACVKNLPLSQLKIVLLELHKRLKTEERRSSSSSARWLKEILSYHLPNLITCDEDLRDILNKISDLINIRYISQTLSRMRLLKGLLQVQRRNTSTDESSSSDSDIEELDDS